VLGVIMKNRLKLNWYETNKALVCYIKDEEKNRNYKLQFFESCTYAYSQKDDRSWFRMSKMDEGALSKNDRNVYRVIADFINTHCDIQLSKDDYRKLTSKKTYQRAKTTEPKIQSKEIAR
jgi:hypothetical protein